MRHVFIKAIGESREKWISEKDLQFSFLHISLEIPGDIGMEKFTSWCVYESEVP